MTCEEWLKKEFGDGHPDTVNKFIEDFMKDAWIASRANMSYAELEAEILKRALMITGCRGG